MGIKDFFLKQALKYKMKDVPEAQREMLMGAMEKHPEFFKKIGDEVKLLTKQGMSEMAATMQVMRKHQAELQKIMME
jgi:adenylosuccinate synthase